MKTFKEILRKLLMLVAIVAIAYSGYQLYLIQAEKNQSKSVNKEINEIVGTKEDDEIKFLTQKTFSELHAINNDFVGYLHYPSLNINEPIVQTTDNAYYLDRSFYHDYMTFGTVFMSYDQQKTDQNRTLYGHWVSNSDAKFSNLHKLRDVNNYEANKIFYYSDDEFVYEYEVAHVIYHDSVTGEDNVPYWQGNFSEQQFYDFVANAKNQEIYSTGVEMSPDDKIMSLQTCISFDTDQRLVVIGKEISRTPIEVE